MNWFVPGTGPSGVLGFTEPHPRLDQANFDYSHSEYFERSHMEGNWIPFLRSPRSFLPPADLKATRPGAGIPWGLYLGYAAILGGLVWLSAAAL